MGYPRSAGGGVSLTPRCISFLFTKGGHHRATARTGRVPGSSRMEVPDHLGVMIRPLDLEPARGPSLYVSVRGTSWANNPHIALWAAHLAP